MLDINYIYLIFFVLIIFQSIAGVGVLVIGTPVLLILGFEFLDVISILLGTYHDVENNLGSYPERVEFDLGYASSMGMGGI